jgi:outer membrane protein assembly factor BamB/ribosomal protein L40E
MLGATGLATTYAARDSANGSQVVVKIVSSYFRGNLSTVQPFLDEMERVKTLRHPNVMSLLEVGRDAERWWLVYERAQHPSLARQPQPFTLAATLTLLQDVAAALDYAHAQGVRHGNLKPANTFVDADGHARIGDFGMGLLGDAVHPLVRSTLNTPHPCYSAPERTQGFSTGPSTDVYSLAVLGYQLLTGSLPIFALGASAMLAKQMTMDPPAPSSVNHALPSRVDDVLLRALSRRPEVRPTSPSALVASLREALAPLDRGLLLPERPEDETSERPIRPTSAASTAAAVEQAKAAGTTKLCPSCGAENPEGAAFCRSCWSRIGQRRGATLDEVRYLRRLAVRAALQRRLVTGTIVFVLFALLAFKVVWDVTGPTHFLAAPTSQIASVPTGTDWAMFRRDPLHSGVVTGPVDIKGEALWRFQAVGEPLQSAPAVVNGRVYQTTGDRRVVALDAATGRVLWQTPTTGPVDSSPAVAGGLVFFGLRDGRVVALNADNGQQRWEFQTGNPVITSPAVANGTVYATSGDGSLYAIDAQTGKKRWTWEYGGFLLGSPAVIGDAVMATSSLGILHVLDAISGRHRLSYSLNASVQSSPAVHGGRMYIGTDNGKVLAWDWRPVEYPFERGWMRWRQYMVRWKMLPGPTPLQKGHLWGVQFRRNAFSAPAAVTADTVYLASREGLVLALNADTGETRWSKTIKGSVWASPLMVGSDLYIATRDGALYVFDAKTGEQRRQLAIGGGVSGQIVVAGGTMYLPSIDGTLYAVR